MPLFSKHMHTSLKSLALLALTATVVSAQSAAPAPAEVVTVDAKLPDYAVSSGVSGNLNSVGSDTLNNLMTSGAKPSRASILTSTSRSKARDRAPLRSPSPPAPLRSAR